MTYFSSRIKPVRGFTRGANRNTNRGGRITQTCRGSEMLRCALSAILTVAVAKLGW